MGDPPDPKGPDGPDNTLKGTRRKKGVPLPPITSKETDDLKEVLKSKEVELNSLSETNRILHEKIREMVDQAERLEETQQQLAKYKTENRRLNEIIKQKDNAIEGLKNDHQISIKQHGKTENKLKKTLLELEEKVNEQEDKNASNSSDNLTAVANLFFDKFKEVEENLKRSILNEVSSSQKLLEDKINEVVVSTSSYADAMTNATLIEKKLTSIQQPVPNFRDIMRQEQNNQLAEEAERKERESNIVIHGLKESSSDDVDVRKKHDGELIKSLIKDIGVDVVQKTMFRLGKRSETDEVHKRPIKISMSNVTDKQKIMDNLRNLKGNADYQRVSITDDHTLKERKLIKDMVEEVKDANSKEPKESLYVWKLHGSPKNGLSKKKFKKRTPPAIVEVNPNN